MYAPIVQTLEALYPPSDSLMITLNAQVWIIQAIPGAFIAIWLFRQYSYTTVLTLSVLLQVCGGWLRSYAIVTGSFLPIFVGTSVLSFSNSILCASQNIVINKWFPVNEYGLASSLLVATNIVMVFGFGTAALVFEKDGNTIETLNRLIWNSNVFITVVFMFYLVTFKSKPEIPPSRVAMQEHSAQHLMHENDEMWGNRNFRFINLVAFEFVLFAISFTASALLFNLSKFFFRMRQPL